MCNEKNLSKCLAKSTFPARMFDQINSPCCALFAIKSSFLQYIVCISPDFFVVS